MENGIKNGTTNIHVSNIIDIKIPPLLLAWGVLYFKVYFYKFLFKGYYQINNYYVNNIFLIHVDDVHKKKLV
jgi:hypothetical protein